MENEFEALQNQWQKDKNSIENDAKENSIEEVLSIIRKNKTWSTCLLYTSPSPRDA